MERTGIEPVTSDLQIPGFEARLGQIRLVNVKLRWLCEVEIGYSGTRFGTRFSCGSAADADVSIILTKLGVARRAEAAAVAEHLDLVSSV
jgi:hypothetical protein